MNSNYTKENQSNKPKPNHKTHTQTHTHKSHKKKQRESFYKKLMQGESNNNKNLYSVAQMMVKTSSQILSREHWYSYIKSNLATYVSLYKATEHLRQTSAAPLAGNLVFNYYFFAKCLFWATLTRRSKVQLLSTLPYLDQLTGFSRPTSDLHYSK